MKTVTQVHDLKIVTAAWSTKLPPDVVRIGISRGWPRRTSGFRRLPRLAPGRWWNSVGEAEYIERYERQLADLNPVSVYERLIQLACGAPAIALLCFERPGSSDGWCHRSLAARWLSQSLGMMVPEFGFENFAQHQHPLLPPSLLENRPWLQTK